MSTSRINLQLAHDKLGTLARDVVFLEKKLEAQHPDLYHQIALDLNQVIQSLYYVRNEIRRYDYRIIYKSIFK